MKERYFLKHSGITVGPFEENRLLAMYQRGEIADADELSVDKQSWEPVAEHFTAEQPPEEMPDPECVVPPEPETDAEVAEFVEVTEDPCEEATPEKVPLNLPAEEVPWNRIPSEVIRLLWNAPEALEKLPESGKRFKQAGWFAVLLAFLLTAYANGLFAGRYGAARNYIWGASYAGVVLSLLLSYGVMVFARRWQHGAAAKMQTTGIFPAAWAVMLSMVGVHTISLALFFLLKAEWSPTRLRLALPLGIWLFFTALFGVNAFLGMRRTLAEGCGLEDCPARAVSLVWNVILFYGYLQGIAIPVIRATGAGI